MQMIRRAAAISLLLGPEALSRTNPVLLGEISPSRMTVDQCASLQRPELRP
jgi:hypothetical protein